MATADPVRIPEWEEDRQEETRAAEVREEGPRGDEVKEDEVKEVEVRVELCPRPRSARPCPAVS